MTNFLPFLILLMIVAAVLREHAVLTVFYLLAAVYIGGVWWSRRSLSQIKFTRHFTHRVFLNQIVPVRVELDNTGLLPLVWLTAHESLPLDLIVPNFISRTVSVSSRGSAALEYTLRANKRGYYPVGPMFLSTGDLLGLAKENKVSGQPDYLTVYPRIVSMPRLRLPSQSPFGTLRHTSPIFEDPSRVKGKREYQVGDSLRSVDWKATASSGRMQVKMYEPSINLETAVFLNLHLDDYAIKHRYVTTELAITAAASLANWAVGRKQPVAFYTNGFDPLSGGMPQPVPSRKGTGHLMSILDILARIQTGESMPFERLLQTALHDLAWGSTLVVITAQQSESLFDSLFQAQRMGMTALLYLMGSIPDFRSVQARARHFGIPAYQIQLESDLEAQR